LPHGGVEYPAELAGELATSPEVLWSDWQTRELYDFLPELGIATITTGFSRFVADVNRDPDGEQHGSFWSSVVAARLPSGEPVYRRELTRDEIVHRVWLAHRPFHQALDETVERRLREFPRILVLDLHSFGVPLGADVILGDRHGRTARPETTALVRDAFTRNGLTVLLNERFPGGWTIRRFTGNDRVDAIAVELNQRRYLDLGGHEYPAPPPAGVCEAAKRTLRSALGSIPSSWVSSA
jgi:N-formylglutamate amidohydrolase